MQTLLIILILLILLGGGYGYQHYGAPGGLIPLVIVIALVVWLVNGRPRS